MSSFFADESDNEIITLKIPFPQKDDVESEHAEQFQKIQKKERKSSASFGIVSEKTERFKRRRSSGDIDSSAVVGAVASSNRQSLVDANTANIKPPQTYQFVQNQMWLTRRAKSTPNLPLSSLSKFGKDPPLRSNYTSQKKSLVEREKRKLRMNKERGPEERYIFHMKLEEEGRKKGKGRRKRDAANPSEMTQASKPDPDPEAQQRFPPKTIIQHSHNDKQTYNHRPEIDLSLISSIDMGYDGTPTPSPQSSTSEITQTSSTLEFPLLPPTIEQSSMLDSSFPHNSRGDDGHSTTAPSHVSIIEALMQAMDMSIPPTLISLTDGCIIKCNIPFCNLLVQPLLSIESTLVQNLIHPEDRPQYHFLLMQVLSNSAEVAPLNVRLLDHNRRAIRVHFEVCSILNCQMLPQWLVFRAISHTQLNEVVPLPIISLVGCKYMHLLRKSDILVGRYQLPFVEMFGCVLDNAFADASACFFVDGGLIQWCNEQFAKILGVTSPEGSRFSDMSSAHDLGLVKFVMEALQNGEEKLEIESAPLRLSSQQEVTVKLLFQRVSKADGGLLGHILVLVLIESSGRNQEASDCVFHPFALKSLTPSYDGSSTPHDPQSICRVLLLEKDVSYPDDPEE